MKTNKDLSQFLKTWVKDEEVKKHINTLLEKELHKALLKWSTTGKISLSAPVCRHRKTAGGFIDSEKYRLTKTICLKCGKVLPKKVLKNA